MCRVVEHMSSCGLMDKAPPSPKEEIASSRLVSNTVVQAYAHSLCSGLHSTPLTESPCQGGSRCGARLPGSRSHTRSINMPRHEILGRSWEIVFQQCNTMMAPAHAQGHAGPAWSPPGGLEPPTIPGLEVRRRIHDAKGAMLERLMFFHV